MHPCSRFVGSTYQRLSLPIRLWRDTCTAHGTTTTPIHAAAICVIVDRYQIDTGIVHVPVPPLRCSRKKLQL